MIQVPEGREASVSKAGGLDKGIRAQSCRPSPPSRESSEKVAMLWVSDAKSPGGCQSSELSTNHKFLPDQLPVTPTRAQEWLSLRSEGVVSSSCTGLWEARAVPLLTYALISFPHHRDVRWHLSLLCDLLLEITPQQVAEGQAHTVHKDKVGPNCI